MEILKLYIKEERLHCKIHQQRKLCILNYVKHTEDDKDIIFPK